MRKYFTNNDIILIIAILTVSAVFTVFLYTKGRTGDTVSVYVDGKSVGEYLLCEDTVVDIEGFGGGHNRLTIQDGCAFMSEASCPDRLCIHQGRISKEGQMIVCMPNRVVISVPVSGTGEGSGYDAISQ